MFRPATEIHLISLVAADAVDPCMEKVCSYGSQCVPAKEDLTGAKCVCLHQCSDDSPLSKSQIVCGSDDIEYPSICHLKRTSCLQLKEISVKSTGACGKLVS